MMNGEAKQFLLKAAEDGEILPREGLFPPSTISWRQGKRLFLCRTNIKNRCRRTASNRTVPRNYADRRDVPAGRRRLHRLSTRGPGHGRPPRGSVADRRRVAVAGTRQGCTARLPSCEAYLFWILHSCAPLASPHTSTRWTPQGSSLARDRQECVIGPITPSIKGPFRPGPSASPDRAPFLEPGSNQADRPRGPRGFSGHTWCFLCFPFCGVHYRNLSPSACWRCVPLAARTLGSVGKENNKTDM